MSVDDRCSTTAYPDGVRGLEIGVEKEKYCGRVLAGLGADVVRVEPPGGEVTRSHPDRSLYFWHYNLDKRSVVLDLGTETGRGALADLAEVADVVVESRPRACLEGYGVCYDALRQHNEALVHLKTTPFGDDGPWADWEASDLTTSRWAGWS